MVNSGNAGEQMQDLLYRNGFIVFDTSKPVELQKNWKTEVLGALTVASHPETPVALGVSRGVHIAVLGLAFDPELGIYDDQSLLGRLLADVHSQDSFYSTLDRLAGRFTIIVHFGKRTELYQDAMGSRSVFYAATGPSVAASHAELVRRAIGSSYSDFFIPFITSKNYLQRDVKYLPGVATPFDDVLQLTPNTKLILPDQKVERFWPRAALGPTVQSDHAASVLVDHLRGMSAFMQHRGLRPVVGLTAGTDSRGVFAGIKDLNPYVFTYVRSETGESVASKDARTASQIAAAYGIKANVWPVKNRLSLNDTDDEFSKAFRLATGYYRGPGSPWLRSLMNVRAEVPNGLFVRGFGGEVMRGFYQSMGKKIRKISVFQLADTYDVNAGSNITRRLFGDMMDITSFDAPNLHGLDPNDVFYWEHRMGTWGSVSMAEADLAMPSIVGYNSRNLYQTFMRLTGADRSSREAFNIATDRLAPTLPYDRD